MKRYMILYKTADHLNCYKTLNKDCSNCFIAFFNKAKTL